MSLVGIDLSPEATSREAREARRQIRATRAPILSSRSDLSSVRSSGYGPQSSPLGRRSASPFAASRTLEASKPLTSSPHVSDTTSAAATVRSPKPAATVRSSSPGSGRYAKATNSTLHRTGSHSRTSRQQSTSSKGSRLRSPTAGVSSTSAHALSPDRLSRPLAAKQMLWHSERVPRTPTTKSPSGRYAGSAERRVEIHKLDMVSNIEFFGSRSAQDGNVKESSYVSTQAFAETLRHYPHPGTDEDELGAAAWHGNTRTSKDVDMQHLETGVRRRLHIAPADPGFSFREQQLHVWCPAE